MKRLIVLILSLGVFAAAGIFSTTGCAITATRPTQEMAYTASSLQAAREVQADRLAPELFRQATEWFFKARKEYQFKDFEKAKFSAKKARHFAEKAEFEALSNGGIREGIEEDEYADPLANPPPPSEK